MVGAHADVDERLASFGTRCAQGSERFPPRLAAAVVWIPKDRGAKVTAKERFLSFNVAATELDVDGVVTLVGGVMKNPLFGCAALIAIAANIPATAAAATPNPAWDWSGFYVGGNVGYGVGSDQGQYDDQAPGFSPTPERFNYSPAGAIGGGQLGFNWQLSPSWVLGFESDFQASSQLDNFTCVQQCLNVPATALLNGTNVDQRLNWFGTARGRVGWSSGPALWYVTGGLSFGELSSAINTIQANGSSLALNFDDTKVGWALGGGLEYRVWGNWTAKAEYLYVDFGNVSHTFVTNNPLTGFPTTSIYASHVRDNIVRLGLNYKFGSSDAGAAPAALASTDPPLIYKAPISRSAATSVAIWNWTGFYAGVNAGGGVARDPFTKIGTFNTTGNPILDESFYLMPRGVIGGGQIGFNWQVSSVVLGAEADYQFSGQDDDTTCATFCDPTPGGSIALIQQKLPWFATVRGRVGWTNGPGLIYVTGGAAVAQVKTNISQSDFNSSPLVLNAFDFNQNKAGFTFGGGIEHQIIGNWTAKVEYLYIGLGGFNGTYLNPAPPSLFATTHSFTSSTHDNIVRVGLNYKLGGPAIVSN